MTLHFENASQAAEWAIDFLKTRDLDRLRNEGIDVLLNEGYSVIRPGERAEWMSAEEARQRFAPHLGNTAFHKRLHHADAPLYARKESATGRLLKLLPTPELIAWLSRPLAPGRRRDLEAV